MYAKLKEVIINHYFVVETGKQKLARMFPWVNRTISNAKKYL